MKLKTLLRTHQQSTIKAPSALVIPNNLGDGYLLAHNPIYRNIRHAALQARFRFSDKRFHDYDVLSLTQLPKILKTKVIPYADNVSCLAEIEDSAPNTFQWADLPPVRANYLLHESAHAVVNTLRMNFEKNTAKTKAGNSRLSKDQELVLSTLIDEAFANAIEALANIYAHEAIHDEFLFKNSYVMEKPTARKALRATEKKFGIGPTFQILFFAFLFANFQQTDIAWNSFVRVLKIVFEKDTLAQLSNKDLNALKKVFQTGLELDPEFTIFTNRFCLRLLGVKKDLKTVLNFDFLKTFENGLKYASFLKEMNQFLP